MRVAVLSPLFESVPPKLYGGTERVVYNLCQGLVKKNIEVELFATGDSVSSAKLMAVIEHGIRLSSMRYFDPMALNFQMLTMVAKRAGDFDVIHNHNDYWMLPLTQMVRTPLLTTTHGRMDPPELEPVFGGFSNAAFVSISASQRASLPTLRWVSTIHHGIDLESFQFQKTPGRYLAFLGRISFEKRPEWAIEIAKRSGVPLKIAAKVEGALGQNYYDTFVKPHVDGRFIEYVGEISEAEKSEFLGNALALVFPVDWPEPFGLVVIESLACGTPVLARPCGAMPELLEDGCTGYMSMDIDTLSRRVEQVHSIDRSQCRSWVEARFSVGRMTEDYIDVYRQIITKPTRGEQSRGKTRSDHNRGNFLHPVQRIADGNSEN
jgi:glycosyltransferase involved in cell wall biosynthesis